MEHESRRFWAPHAWVDGRWQADVLLGVDSTGHWNHVQPCAYAQELSGATVLQGPVLPGVVNAHSHAFQRAIAGLTERRSTAAGAAGTADDFWSWRDRMYSAAMSITPEQLQTIATHLYAELLAGGYTQVCEFHYLHNDRSGQAYADPAEMSLALVRAAQATGIGLTLLPTLYMRSGFAAGGLRDDQRRFASTPESIVRIVESVQRQTPGDTHVTVGVALHSLRAVAPEPLHELAAYAKHQALPVHIHIAEQTQEVDDCLAHTGQRPIEWLLAHTHVDSRWNLVHATHTTPAELHGVKAAGASIVICPSTEANLGDGVFDLPGHGAVQGEWSIGSDSHVTRRWSEELRLLEYSQRLALRQRNVAARVLQRESNAAAMLQAVLRGGHPATGLPLGGLALGQRADFWVLPSGAASLQGIPQEHLLDALVFSSPDAAPEAVYVAGQTVHKPAPTGFAQTMESLWGK